jgi:hypothetical protein
VEELVKGKFMSDIEELDFWLEFFKGREGSQVTKLMIVCSGWKP